jgi:hypothetical protein
MAEWKNNVNINMDKMARKIAALENVNKMARNARRGSIASKEWLRQLARWRVHKGKRSVTPFSGAATVILRGGGPNVKRSFAYCSIPKNGSSHWRRLMRRLVGYKDFHQYPHMCFQSSKNIPKYVTETYFHGAKIPKLWWKQCSKIKQASAQHWKEALKPKRAGSSSSHALKPIFSFVFVRDPFSRFLSAYLEKIALSKTADKKVAEGDKDCMPDKYHSSALRATPEAFGEYFECFVNKYRDDPCQPNEHFQLQHCMCGLETPVVGEYRLPVEEIREWYKVSRLLTLGSKCSN